MRLLIYGANPKHDSGMGKTGREMAAAMADDHDVHYFCPQLCDVMETYDGFQLHGSPGTGDPARLHLSNIINDVQPDVFMSNKNWQALQWLAQSDGPINRRYIEEGERMPVVFYGPPVESEEKPPWFARRLLDDHLNDVYLIPFTESRYDQYVGDWEIEEYTIPKDAPGWVPHGISHDIFYPDTETRDSWREITGIGDRFIVQFVGENWRRKNIDVLMDGFKQFKASVDGNPILSLHSPPNPSRGQDEFYSGWHLPRLADGIGLDWETNVEELNDDTDVFWTSQYPGDYIEREKVATFIDAADVYALPSSGESFSLTTLEAMACGTPVVQTDCETLRWLSGEHAEYIDVAQEHRLNSGEVQLTPDVDSLADKLELLYGDRDHWADIAVGGRERAKDFSWERTGEEMKAAVEWVYEHD